MIALPGEIFKIEQGKFYLFKDGDFEYIPYTFKTNPSVDEEYEGKDIAWLKLADNEYWVLGDNRENSRDSGAISKAITRNNLIGVLVAIEGKAKLKVSDYICYNCGKTFKGRGVCSNCGENLQAEYGLVNKQYHWPKYF